MTRDLDRQIGGKHYKGMAIQPFEISLANHYDGAIHSVVKYVSRHVDKGGREDLEKALHILGIRAELMETYVAPSSLNTIPIDRYISENEIAAPEASALRMVDYWSQFPDDQPPDIMREVCARELKLLIQTRYP